MVICTFFLNNNCRYGNQCKKEHIDIRLLIKTDIDAVIKGNQWPLSTYGPFKDRPSLHNFISDQSFEEHRAAAYEAKANGTLATLSAQIAQSGAEAKLRMQQLYELNGDSMNMLVTLYNSTLDSSSGSGIGGNPNNPFTKVNNPSVAHNNPFGSKPLIQANPFASGGVATQPSMGSNLFGAPSSMSGAQQSNPFSNGGAAGDNIFGAPATQNAAAAGNIFGGGGMIATSTAASSSIFGGGAQTTFTGGSANQSFFGSASTATAATGNIFGQAASSGMQASGPASNIFGGSSAFGAPAASSVFGGAPSFGQTAGNIFGSGGTVPASVAPTTGIFGQSSLFGNSAGPAAVQQQSAFGANTSVFGAATTANIFGDQAHQVNQAHQQQQNVFGAPVVSQPNMFGNSFAGTNNAFGATPVATSSAFGAAALPVAAAAMTTTMDGMSSTANVFGTAAPSNSVFGSSNNTANPFGTNTPTSGSGEPTAYSRIDELTESEMQAFNAPAFTLGSIPVRPPPQQLCA